MATSYKEILEKGYEQAVNELIQIHIIEFNKLENDCVAKLVVKEAKKES